MDLPLFMLPLNFRGNGGMEAQNYTRSWNSSGVYGWEELFDGVAGVEVKANAEEIQDVVKRETKPLGQVGWTNVCEETPKISSAFYPIRFPK